MRRSLTLSIIDQAVVSAFNFGLNLYFLRLWTPEDFGIFAVIAAASIFAAMIQNAVINTPLAVHLPVADTPAERAMLLRVFSAANLLSALLVLTFGGGLLIAWLGSEQMALVVGASLYLCSQYVREYYRSQLAVEGKLAALLGADAAYVAISAGALDYAHWLAEKQVQTVALALLVLAGAGFLSVARHLVPRRLPALRNLPGEMASVFARQKHEIRWSLLGVITTDVQNRGYIFVAAAVFGPAAVAHLQAGRIFFGPLNLLTGAWSRVARPQLAALLGQGKATEFSTVLRQALWSFTVLNILFLALLWVAWPYLNALVFGDKYQGLGILIAGWGIANTAFQIRSCLSIGVQAMHRFRELTLATIYGAMVSVVIVALACGINAPSGLIASVIGGECVAILVVAGILRRRASSTTPDRLEEDILLNEEKVG